MALTYFCIVAAAGLAVAEWIASRLDRADREADRWAEAIRAAQAREATERREREMNVD